MKEIINLQARVIAHAPQLAEGRGIDFSREESGGDFEALSPELRGEIDALQSALNETIPEDFEYYVFIGGDEGPFFGLEFDRSPTGPGDEELDPERSLFDQLRPLDWEAAREKARSTGATMQNLISLLDRVARRLPPAKSLQREYREAVKDFVREKRRDAGKVHVLYLSVEGELMEVNFDDGEAFRATLPGMVGHGENVFGIVANGKPLPVERIDALNAQAQKAFKEGLKKESETAREEEESEPATEIIDTEPGSFSQPA